MRRGWSVALLAVVVVGAACTAPSRAVPAGAAEPTTRGISGPSRLTLAVQNDVSVLATKLQVGPGVSGGVGHDLSALSNSPLVVLDGQGMPQPRLAAELPSREQGTWTIHPDGTMATTWRIRPNARWHDGQPVTSRDFAFALQVYLDPEVAVIHRNPERLVERIEAVDDATFIIHWNQFYRSANRLIVEELEPLPEHILAAVYERGDKTGFQNASFWTTPSYVGNGPYVLTDRTEGIQRVYRAFDEYVLGRPKIDEVVVRMMPDQNSLLANLLSGAVDATTSTTLNQQSGLTLQQEWDRTGDGRLVNTLATFIFAEFQHHPERVQQPALLDVRVRRAIAYGIDRVALNAVVSGGRAPTPEAPMHPADPLYPRADQFTARYPYDVARALSLLEEAGWRKPTGKLVDGDGEPFRVNARTVARADNETVVRIMAGDLTALGMDVAQTTLSVAEDSDREQRARFPGLGLHTVSTMEVPEGLADFTTAECATADNRWTGRNRRCWSNAEFDRLFRFATTTVDGQVRADSTVQMLRLFAEDVAIVPLTYYIHNIAARRGLAGVSPHWHAQRGSTWFIHEWRWE